MFIQCPVFRENQIRVMLQQYEKVSWEVRRMLAIKAASMYFLGLFVLFVVQKEALHYQFYPVQITQKKSTVVEIMKLNFAQ